MGGGKGKKLSRGSSGSSGEAAGSQTLSVSVSVFRSAVSCSLSAWRERAEGEGEMALQEDFRPLSSLLRSPSQRENEESQRTTETEQSAPSRSMMVTPDEKVTRTGGGGQEVGARGGALQDPETGLRVSWEEVHFPAHLCAQQRRVVHRVAGDLDLFHTSRGCEGDSAGRVVTVSRSLPADYHCTSNESTVHEAGVRKPFIRYAYFLLTDEERYQLKKGVQSHLSGWTSRLSYYENYDSTASPHGTEKATASTTTAFSFLAAANQQSSPRPENENTDTDYSVVEQHLVNVLHTLRSHHAVELSSGLDIGLQNVPAINSDSNILQYRWVDSVSALESMCSHLQGCRMFAMDMEMHSTRSFFGHTCLLQFSTSAQYSGYSQNTPSDQSDDNSYDLCDYDYVVDAIALWDHIGTALKDALANPKILKVVHGAGGGDIPALFRDFGLVLVSIFDTQEACSVLKQRSEQQLNSQKLGKGWWGGKVGLGTVLTALHAHIVIPHTPVQQNSEKSNELMNFEQVKKKLALADWRIRPLREDMLAYARTDTRFLLPLCALLLHHLCEQAYEMSVQDIAAIVVEEENETKTRVTSSSIIDDECLVLWHDVPSPPAPKSNQLVVPKNDNEKECDISAFELPPAHVITDPVPHLNHRLRRLYLHAVGRNILKIIVVAQKNATSLWVPGSAPTPLSSLLSPSETPRPHHNIYKKIDAFKRLKKSKRWTPVHTHVLMRLAEWRHSVAFEADESPAFVCPSCLLCHMALASAPSENMPQDCNDFPLQTPADLLKVQCPLPQFLFLPFASASPSPPGSPQHNKETDRSLYGDSTQQLVGGGALGVLLVIKEALRECCHSDSADEKDKIDESLNSSHVVGIVTPAPVAAVLSSSVSTPLVGLEGSPSSYREIDRSIERELFVDKNEEVFDESVNNKWNTSLIFNQSIFGHSMRSTIDLCGTWAERSMRYLYFEWFSGGTLPVASFALLLLAVLPSKIRVHRGGDAS